jgi:hypothetical protein
MKSIQVLRRSLNSLIALAVATFTMIGSASATSANTDVTDIWWNRNKSGNGYQLVNTGTFVFATGYVYGPNRQPFWISGELRKTGAALATFTGPLYVNTGPYFGGPYDPATVTSRMAGTMTFVLTAINTGQLSYSVDGVFVNEPIERQPLTLDNYSGYYLTGVTESITGCFDPANNGTYAYAGTASVAQNGQSIVLTTTATGVACTVSGTYSQSGRMGEVNGPYACTSGEVGTARIFEMNSFFYGFNARLQFHSTTLGCNASGKVAGLIPN